MKLYLHLQIEQRALEVWGSEDNLLKQKEARDIKREEAKIKKFNKKVTYMCIDDLNIILYLVAKTNFIYFTEIKIKQLRMQVRSSLYDKTTKASHVHEFGEDTYNEEDDTYTHICTTCGYEETYEKM